MAPELAVPGKTTAVLVTLHGPSSVRPLNVTLRLVPDDPDVSGTKVVETTQEIRGEQCRIYIFLNGTFSDLIWGISSVAELEGKQL